MRLALPFYGHDDEDDRAGYVYSDAHKRDDQAWQLATSERPILDAFSSKYASDQYGGLLAFNSLVYRYLSPDAQQPLMLIVFSAFFAALGVSFLWKAVNQVFGENVAWASAWIFALYPDSVLLGASAMREPYLLTFSAIVLWGFVHRFYRFEESPTLNRLSDLPNLLRDRIGWMWIALGLAGMLLVSQAVALLTMIILAGWLFFTNERREISWRGIGAIAITFAASYFLLAHQPGIAPGLWWVLSVIISCGTVAGALIPEFTKVFTSSHSKHVHEIVTASREGGASLTILSGLVAGNFSGLAGATTTRVARFNADGTADSSFEPAVIQDGAVLALALQPDGRLLVAGSFSFVGGKRQDCIARLNVDGSLDETFSTGSGFTTQFSFDAPRVGSIAVQPDGIRTIRVSLHVAEQGLSVTAR